MHSLIIHLTSAVARQPNVAHLRDVLPGAEVIEAQRGADHTPAQGDLHHPRYPFPIGPGEVGCLLSHRACWQTIIDRGWDGALIAEDDLVLSDPWPDAFALLTQQVAPDRYIRLPAKAREAGPVLAQQGVAQLIKPKIIGLQTVFQYVGRDAAARLLAATDIIDRPVDTFLQMHWVHGQDILSLLPCGVSEAPAGGSTIQRKARSGRLAREVKRFAYRPAVAPRPQRP